MRRRPFLRPLAALGAAAVTGALVVAAAPPAQAAPSCTRTWDGGAVDASWHTATNWDTDVLPTASDVVCIATSNATVNVTSAVSVNGIVITAGTLRMQAAGTVGSGGVTVDAQSLSVAGTLEAPTSPATLAVDGPVTVAGGTLTRNGGGPAGQITQTAGKGLLLSGKTFIGGDRTASLGSTTITTQSSTTFSGFGQLNGFSLSTPGVSLFSATWTAINGPNSISTPQVGNADTATLAADVTLTGPTPALSAAADLTIGGLSGPAGAAVDIADVATLSVTGGTYAGSVTGAGNLRKRTGGQLTLSGAVAPASVVVNDGEVVLSSGAAFTPGGLQLVGTTGNPRLRPELGSTVTIGAGGLLMDSAATGRYGMIDGCNLSFCTVTVTGPVDILDGTLQNVGLHQTGSGSTTLGRKSVNAPQLNFVDLSTQQELHAQGVFDVRASQILGRTLRLEPGTVLGDANIFTTNGWTFQGIITSPGALAQVKGSNVNVNGTLSDLAGGLSVLAPFTVLSNGSIDVPASTTLSATGGVEVRTGGTLSGSGTVDADLLNKGTVAPGGGAVSTLTAKGYAENIDGVLEVQLASAASFDKVVVTGASAPGLLGTTKVSCLGGYAPANNQTFDVVTAVTAPGGAPAVIDTCPGTLSGAVVGSSLRLTASAPVTTVPGAPGVDLVPQVNGLDVTITPPANDGGSPITGYAISCTPACPVINPVPAGTTSLTGLVADQTYTVSVTATNLVGTGAATTVDGVPLAPTTTVPGAPGVVLTAKVESLDVAITAPADDGGSPITGYEITCVPACTSVTNPVQAGTTTLTGLTGGTSYAVTVVAINTNGSSTPTTVTKAALAPAATSTVSTTTAVVTTSGSFKVTCSHNRGLVKACGAVLKGSNGTIYGQAATVKVDAGAATITVTVKVNSAGITASKKLGGLAGTVFITTTPVTDPVTVTKKSIRVTQKTTSRTWKSSSFFTTTGTSLTSAGKTALIAVAKAVQGSKTFRCEVNVARTSSATNDYNRGLKRATAVCAFIKATIKAKGWKPIGTYTLKSWGSTRPISLSKAWVKLTAGN